MKPSVRVPTLLDGMFPLDRDDPLKTVVGFVVTTIGQKVDPVALLDFDFSNDRLDGLVLRNPLT